MGADKWTLIIGAIAGLARVIIDGVKLVLQLIDRKTSKGQEAEKATPASDQD
jgi:hypothetical protein